MQKTIGENIREYRKRQGLSQKELGEKVGVTSQAVSNWECGGVPNAEIIPDIAEALFVSIDELFSGRAIKKDSLYDRLMQELRFLDGEEQMKRAFELCYAVLISLHIPYQKENEGLFSLENALCEGEKKNYFYTKMEQGYAYGSLRKKEEYLFFMPEPEGGYKAEVLSLETYLRFFGQFSNPEYFRVLLFFFSRRNIPLTKEVLAAKCHVNPERIDKILAELLQNGWLMKKTACVDGVEEEIYQLIGNYAFLTFLLTAKDLMMNKEDFTAYLGVNNRLDKSMFSVGREYFEKKDA